jgi:cation transport ATPase
MMKKLLTMTVLVLSMISINAFATTLKLKVNGMVCAFCAQSIEKKMKAQPETQTVYVNLKAHLVAVELKEGKKLSEQTVFKIIKDAGYEVTSFEESDHSIEHIKAGINK